MISGSKKRGVQLNTPLFISFLQNIPHFKLPASAITSLSVEWKKRRTKKNVRRLFTLFENHFDENPYLLTSSFS